MVQTVVSYYGTVLENSRSSGVSFKIHCSLLVQLPTNLRCCWEPHPRETLRKIKIGGLKEWRSSKKLWETLPNKPAVCLTKIDNGQTL